jgi:hypothetical protein
VYSLSLVFSLKAIRPVCMCIVAWSRLRHIE